MEPIQSKEKSTSRSQQVLITHQELQIILDNNNTSAESKSIAKKLATIKIKQINQYFGSQLQKCLYEERMLHEKSTQHVLEQLLGVFDFCVRNQIPKFVLMAFFEGYKGILISRIGKQHDVEMFMKHWKRIPTFCIQDYLGTFKQSKAYFHDNHPKHLEYVKQLLLENKLKDAAFYYVFFEKRCPDFEKNYLLPKLLKGEELYTTSVIKLLQFSPYLLQQIIAVSDPVCAMKVAELAGEDVTKYPRIIEHLERENYHHHVKQFKDWYKVEEKFGYNPRFLKWYAEEHLSGDIQRSVLIRAGYQKALPGEIVTQNPIIANDRFTFTEDILPNPHNYEYKFWRFTNFKISEEDIYFIDSETSPHYQAAKNTLLSAGIVGFDSEFKAVSHKYQAAGTSLLQFSVVDKVFLFDSFTLSKSEDFRAFLLAFFNNSGIIKVGHTIKSDNTEISKTFNIPTDKFGGLVDIVDLFKQKYRGENQSSLSFITFTVTGKSISKYEQRSNWNKRPLRKCQIHYAAMDAFICVLLYDRLVSQQTQTEKSYFTIGSELKPKEKHYQEIYKTDNFSYGLEYKHFMNNPLFLVDNMLKKLALYLRNLGLDAEYLSQKDFDLAVSIAKKEQRIILTKDKNLRAKKNLRVPVYLLEAADSQQMTREVTRFFQLDLNKYSLLSRCVKCNSGDIIIIERDVALKELNFKHEDINIKQFWKCAKCNQIYWEGNSFQNSKKRFSAFKE